MTKDTMGKPGQAPGLSTFTQIELAVGPGGKVQVIDLDRLQPPLRGIPDPPSLEGGQDGHVSIAPLNDEGEIDQDLLEQWAASRGTDQIHPLTDLLKQALVEVNVRRPK